MNVGIGILAAVVTVGAAVRSTWSPCGLSMLSTITPVAEAGRGHRYRSTAAWFVLGATAGGATLGTAAALLALALSSASSSPSIGLVALGAALVAAVSDAGIAGIRLPIHRRQVNERWLDRYRPWVYGAGFGWQIGAGLATYITTAAVYLMIVLAVLTGSPAVALAIGTGFGLLRGLAVLLTRRLTTPAELIAFHRRFADRGPLVGRSVAVVEALVALVLVGLVGNPSALVVVGATVAACVAIRAGTGIRARVAVRS